MPIKKLTLGLGLLLAGAVTAGAGGTYKIKSGDTISGIASRFHVKTRDILRANDLTASSNLKIGRVIRIPNATTSASSDTKSAKSAPGGSYYVVRNGDQDWSIARKMGTTPPKIRALNPGVDWNRIQIGQKIRVPGSGSSVVARHTSSSKKSASVKAGGTYKIRPGDNDWIIARRFDTTPTAIRRLNPGLNWDRIQIGHAIKVPGHSGSVVASKSGSSSSASRIRSRYAVVTGDNATIRRAPSLRGDRITTVPSGTRVTVLDRDGEWYRLRFPRGTEGWVRGDLLKATSAPKASGYTATRRRSSGQTRHVATHHEYKPEPVARYAPDGTKQAEILSRAQAMRGVRYRLGASSRSATDCSGFTSQVFARSGYHLPRTSSEQSGAGQRVSRASLQPGDLVFFKTRRGTRVSHVGIYMGKGKFIHASSGGGKVQINSLSDDYYNRRFVTGRRVVKPAKKVVTKRTPVKAQAKVVGPKAESEVSPAPSQETVPEQNNPGE